MVYHHPPPLSLKGWYFAERRNGGETRAVLQSLAGSRGKYCVFAKEQVFTATARMAAEACFDTTDLNGDGENLFLLMI